MTELLLFFSAFLPMESDALILPAVITLVFLLMLKAVKGIVVETGLLLAFFFGYGTELFLLVLSAVQLLLAVLVMLRLKMEIDTYSIRIQEKTHLIPRVITKSGKSGEASSPIDRLLF